MTKFIYRNFFPIISAVLGVLQMILLVQLQPLKDELRDQRHEIEKLYLRVERNEQVIENGVSPDEYRVTIEHIQQSLDRIEQRQLDN